MKKYRVTVDGIEYLVQVEEREAGVYTAKLGEKEVEVRVEEIIDAVKNKTVRPAPGSVDTTIPNKVKSNSDAQVTGVALRSPMPGNVIKVNVSEGSRIKHGEPVIILEAMKMNNEIPSPVDGIVKEIRVKEGDTIDSEHIIAVIEEVA
jgi:biotin carboxyl carrier protein